MITWSVLSVYMYVLQANACIRSEQFQVEITFDLGLKQNISP